MSLIKIVECPRDALQGIKKWIPTKEKVSYLQSLLSVGFDILEFGCMKILFLIIVYFLL